MRDLSYLEDLPSLYKRVKALELNHATQERLIQEIRFGKHQDRDEGGQTAEASYCYRAVYPEGREGQAQIKREQVGIEYPDGWYIAGPMSGCPDHNFPAFNEVAKKMRAKGCRVVNPAELNPDKPGHAIAMRRDIQALLTCRGIMLLPGWEHSRGARAEFFVAESCEMMIHYWEVSCNLYK